MLRSACLCLHSKWDAQEDSDENLCLKFFLHEPVEPTTFTVEGVGTPDGESVIFWRQSLGQHLSKSVRMRKASVCSAT